PAGATKKDDEQVVVVDDGQSRVEEFLEEVSQDAAEIAQEVKSKCPVECNVESIDLSLRRKEKGEDGGGDSAASIDQDSLEDTASKPDNTSEQPEERETAQSKKGN